jgi:hypothetical protein
MPIGVYRNVIGRRNPTMSTGAAPKEKLPFTPDQKQVVGNLSLATQVVAGLLLLLGAIQLIGGPFAWLLMGAGFFGGLATLVQGALTALLGLVMLAVSSDFKFLGQLPQYGGNHFRNVAKNLTAFYQFQLGLALLIGLVVAVRLFLWFFSSGV